MKQYLLLLKSIDFRKYYPSNVIPDYATNVSSNPILNFYPIGVGSEDDTALLNAVSSTNANNVWISQPINLYGNDQYNNYSYIRSRYGLNLIGDRTYVGTELTSPSYGDENSTPIFENAVYKTEIGEVVLDPATPNLLRFIDTSSRIDVLSFKYVFTNLIGSVTPRVALTIFESDSENGPWLKSSISGDTGIIFIKNAKPFVRLLAEIIGDEIDYNQIGLVFYLEIGIHDLTQKVLSDSARNILKRFPSWTYLFEDSLPAATPSLSIPQSTGGKFLNSLVQENLDNFSLDVEIHDINSFISSANENILDWIYISYNVPPNINIIRGDSVDLARVGSLSDLLSGNKSDYSFFYNPIDRQILTLRKFENLVINFTIFEQESVNIFNDFDEFGARVGLPRLYLENNSNYKKRILDVTQNLPGISLEAFKRTTRRELDLWRVYGATPDSNYLGATPEVLEISDIENDPLYFDSKGIALSKFKTLVSDLNRRYPSNLGYAKWGEAIWDYAGLKGEGISRLAAVYDQSTPLGDFFQPGVGDFDDAALVYKPLEASTISFNGLVEISGFKEISETEIYPPVVIDYAAYFKYTRLVSDTSANNVRTGLVYEIAMPAHGSYTTPSTFYANLNYTNNNNFYVTNNYLSNSPSSPEFKTIQIFNQDGYTSPELVFRNKVYGEPYSNSSNRSINIHDAASVNMVFSKTWSHSTQEYSNITVDNYKAKFTYPYSELANNPSPGSLLNLASPNLTPSNSGIKIGSNLYNTTTQTYNSRIYSNSVAINNINDISVSGKSDGIIYISDIKNSDIIPSDGTPTFIYIDAKVQNDLTLFGDDFVTEKIGGKSRNPYDDITYLVPSDANINLAKYDIGNTLIDSPEYFEHATINYNSAVHHVNIYSLDDEYYPFIKINYEYFKAQTTPNIIYGFIDENGNVYKNEEEYNNTYVMGDRYLDSISLNRDSFSLTGTPNYIVDYINFSSTPSSVDIYVQNEDDLIERLNNAFRGSFTTTENIYAENDEVRSSQYAMGINTGNIYFDDNNEEYIYSIPKTETFNGQFFEIELEDTPRKGAPIIVKVDNNDWRNIVFEDSATPGELSFYNTEVVQGASDDNLYLSYKNLSNASVVDTYSGQKVFENLTTDNNIIDSFGLVNYLRTSTTAYAEVDNAQILSGDKFEIMIRFSMDSWTPDGWTWILDKRGIFPNILNGYLLTITSSGSITIQAELYTYDEYHLSFGVGFEPIPALPYETKWIRIKRDKDEVKCYYADDSKHIPSIWNELNPTLGAFGVGDIYDTDTTMWIGHLPGDEDSSANLLGSIYNIKIWNDSSEVSNPVIDIDFTKVPDGTQVFEDSVNKNSVITVVGDVDAISNTSGQPINVDREYEVTYYVNNSFYVDKQVYDSTSDSYKAKLYLSSTPDSNSNYEITYETNQYDNYLPVDLSFNQIDVPLDEGFVYITKDTYDFEYIEAYLSPNYISDSNEDLMYLSIVSYDSNGNLKPFQTFELASSSVYIDSLVSGFEHSNSSYITTNKYGFARAILKYDGDIPALLKSDLINISGTVNSSIDVHPNSQTESYSQDISFSIIRNIGFKLSLKAVPVRFNVEADGVSSVNIVGQIYWNDKPFTHQLELGWSKEKTLYELFENTALDSFFSNEDGSFVLDEIIAQNSDDPDQWFARIEILTNLSDILDLLIADGEAIPSFGITIAGDIVYWNEKYDNIHYSNEPVPILNPGLFIREPNSNIIATPNFIYQHYNSLDIIINNATPNWVPPQWVSLNRFDQYQMGLLGSTPNIISVYENIHPDSGEE